MKSNPKFKNATAEADAPIFITDGILPSGKPVELVRSSHSNQLRLLAWDQNHPLIDEEIFSGDGRYRAIQLHDSVFSAIRFPTGTEEFGTVGQLATSICELLLRWLGLDSPTCWALTAWVLSTWVFDSLPAPPTLAIIGNFGCSMDLCRVLRCVIRRGLLLADIKSSDLDSLAMTLCPTLVLNRHDLPAKMRALLAAANQSGFHIPGRRNKLLKVSGSRAIYLGVQPDAETWEENTLSVTVSSPQPACSRPTAEELDRAGGQLQRQLLMFRLRNSHGVQLSRLGMEANCPYRNELAYNLLACVADDPDLADKLRPQLEAHEEEGRAGQSRDPNCATLEILWPFLHQGSTLTVSDLTQKLNALLRSRGEILTYSPEEVGCRLRNLGIRRARGQKNREVRVSREISQLVHRTVGARGLNLRRHENCPDCCPQVVEQTEAM